MPESAAHRFQRLTSYSPGRSWLVPVRDAEIRQDFLPLDPGCEPARHKVYSPDRVRVPLPDRGRADESLGAQVLSAGADTPANGGAFDLAEIAWLLLWSAGIRPSPLSRSGDHGFRAAASAGNRHPIEVYLNAHRVTDLADGLWHYDPVAHELVSLGPPAADGVAIILTGVPWRTQWRYAERGYRHLWWDAGSVIAQLAALARANGRRARIRLDFPDADVADMVGADERVELPLAIVELTGQIGWHRPERAAAAGDLGSVPWDFPLVRKTHAAAQLDTWTLRSPGHRRPAARDIKVPGQVAPLSTEELVKGRLTTRKFAPEALPADALNWPLEVAVSPPDWDGADPGATVTVFAHAVRGLVAGRYDLSSARPKLDQPGDVRAQAQAACMNQAPARDCAYLVLLAADLDAALDSRGERGYRDLQLYAGLAVSRCQLAATALGLGSCPLTVCDEVAVRFTPPGKIPLLAIAVGSPAGSEVSP